MKIECRDTHIYMKMECLQTKWDAAFLGGKGKDRVTLIKSFFTQELEEVLGGAGYKRSIKVDQSRSNL